MIPKLTVPRDVDGIQKQSGAIPLRSREVEKTLAILERPATDVKIENF